MLQMYCACYPLFSVGRVCHAIADWSVGTVEIMTLFDIVVEAVKVASEKQLAVMIAKGIDRFPDNGDRVAGHLDIWWIVRILHASVLFNFDSVSVLQFSEFEANFIRRRLLFKILRTHNVVFIHCCATPCIALFMPSCGVSVCPSTSVTFICIVSKRVNIFSSLTLCGSSVILVSLQIKHCGNISIGTTITGTSNADGV